MSRFKLVVAISLFAVCYHVNAEVTPEEQHWVEQALSEINANTDDENVLWQYSQQTKKLDLVRIEKFDASQPKMQRWNLVSENGQTPDKERLEEYQQHQQELKQGKDENSHELVFSELIDLTTLVFVGEDDTSVVFKFSPNIDELDNKVLAGLLYLDKVSKQLRKISINNTDDLTPAFSVTLTKFELEFGFDVFDGLVMPAHISTTISGTAVIFKSLDSIQTVTYSDYKMIEKPKA
ncbi:hypothetical protein [Shewanella livingstonensis]|uniref:Uncharacterized protein n=1 Tax=Shewanella livingstonensis TaxID=150120 RepID=A0A3G8LWN8_9GAMM|nr:hypothetical protein [Shewanella livingstonensis]AZG73957.1 hypothetical protein EGC82_15040 [Shewanella livingstonensis]